MTKHYIYMYGSIGCLPDTCEVFTSKKAAIEFAEDLFGDSISGFEEEEMRACLKDDGIHYFFETHLAGADYVSIEPCECGSIRSHRE